MNADQVLTRADGWYLIIPAAPAAWPRVACLWTDGNGRRWLQTEGLNMQPADKGLWTGWEFGQYLGMTSWPVSLEILQ